VKADIQYDSQRRSRIRSALPPQAAVGVISGKRSATDPKETFDQVQPFRSARESNGDRALEDYSLINALSAP